MLLRFAEVPGFTEPEPVHKRQQGLFQGTMVAQGAFSVYRTAALNEVGGWPDRIGEDIVLTWAMMRKGGRVGYERTAIAFTCGSRSTTPLVTRSPAYSSRDRTATGPAATGLVG